MDIYAIYSLQCENAFSGGKYSNSNQICEYLLYKKCFFTKHFMNYNAKNMNENAKHIQG